MTTSKGNARKKLSRRGFLEGVVVGSGLIAATPQVTPSEGRPRSGPAVTSSERMGRGDGRVTAARDENTSEISLSNELIRVCFHPGRPKYGVFPKGYVGYSLQLRDGDQWVTMAEAPFISGYGYRAVHSGRDFLAYVIPQEARVQETEDKGVITFSASQVDTEQVGWHFTFTYSIRPREATVQVKYGISVDQRRELWLFWGPRLYAGEGTFGAAKDEALFAGLEYLGRAERSSDIWAFAPDSKINFVPDPAKVTIPLMAVLHQQRMVGLIWDPTQKWNGRDTGPSALFASPNWIEGKQNHLLGIFLPSIPQYVSENGLRAHTPAVINAGEEIALECQMFASKALHAADAVDVYLSARGGLPISSPPMAADAALEMLVRSLCTNAWDSEAKGWKRFITSLLPQSQITEPDHETLMSLVAATPLLRDRGLAYRAQTVIKEALRAASKHTKNPPSLKWALRSGGIANVLKSEHAAATRRISEQQADGSWTYPSGRAEEQGLVGLNACPLPGLLAKPNSRDEGLTAGGVVPLLEYVLVSGDQDALQAAMRGIANLDQYSIPFGFEREGGYECPHCPCLNGGYLALRSYLLAFQTTGERRYLTQAVYWAKACLPFIYLWSLPPRQVEQGEIETNTYVRGEQLYRATRRNPMLYGSLYGYGSSEFVFSWYGVLVEWIGLVYARHLMALAEHDNTLAWKQIAAGIVGSALWTAYDQLPYSGYYPDGFNLMSWTPSGPGITPSDLLRALLPVHYRVKEEPSTVSVEGMSGDRRYLTSTALIANARTTGNAEISFSLNDAGWSHCRAILTGVCGEPVVTADNKVLPNAGDLEEIDECWSKAEQGQLLIKVRQTEHARQIVVRAPCLV